MSSQFRKRRRFGRVGMHPLELFELTQRFLFGILGHFDLEYLVAVLLDLLE